MGNPSDPPQELVIEKLAEAAQVVLPWEGDMRRSRETPATGKYMPGRSTSKESEKAAERVADEWLGNGIPELPGKTGRPLSETLDIDTVIWTIRQSALTPADAERIVRTLKDRELIETTVVKAGPGTEGLVAFLRRFWDFEGQPVHSGQARARAHASVAVTVTTWTGWIRTCWEPFSARQSSSGSFESPT